MSALGAQKQDRTVKGEPPLYPHREDGWPGAGRRMCLGKEQVGEEKSGWRWECQEVQRRALAHPSHSCPRTPIPITDDSIPGFLASGMAQGP